ncbi:hypothetical protein PTKIN_Ptkin11bG0181000 [Pterospermum kingtungense]
MSGPEEGRPCGEEQAEKKRQGEGCESEEPKRRRVKDEGDSGDDATCNIGIFLEKYFFNGNGFCADNPPPDEDRAIQVQATIQRLFSDEHFCYADILPFSGVRARIRELYKLFTELFGGPFQVGDTVRVLCKSFMRFFSDQDPCYDHILPPHQVQARIKDFLQSLDKNTSPDDSISYVPDVDGGIFKAAEAFIRVWKVMDMCFDILTDENGEGRNWRSTLFDMLRNCSPDYFKSELQVHRTIQDVLALLRCSPYSLGIKEYGGGMVDGLISIMKDPAKDQNYFCGSCRYSIPSDLERVASLHLRSIGAENIIVVEQEEVFQELALNRVFERTRSIVIYAKGISAQGYPDTATRFFLHKLSSLYPHLPVLALVDWSPVGLDILYTNKVLSIGKGLNARRFVCDVKWLGPRGDVVEKIPRYPLNRKDIKIARRLISSGILEGDDETDLKRMIWYSDKAETEALYSLGFNYLEEFLTEKINEAVKEKQAHYIKH